MKRNLCIHEDVYQKICEYKVTATARIKECVDVGMESRGIVYQVLVVAC